MIEAMVRGYHVYKEIWCADVGKELSCVREVENFRDPFAVAVVRLGIIQVRTLLSFRTNFLA